MAEKEFKVNEYITLKLEGFIDNELYTNIYVVEELFDHCICLASHIDLQETLQSENFQSIDELEPRELDLDISDEEEFWGHCSCIQVWEENEYDTRLLHRTIAFPLLKRLTEAGDNIAKKRFKEELIHRIEEGNENVIRFLINEHYLHSFTRKELELLSHTIKSTLGKLIILIVQIDKYGTILPNYFDRLKKNPELAIWGLKNNAPLDFFKFFDEVNKNPELAKWGVQMQNTSSDPEMITVIRFFMFFDKLMVDPELAKWGVKVDAGYGFFEYFDKIAKNPDFAKWGCKNKAPYKFYLYFDILKENIKLAEWAILNKMSDTFYENIEHIFEDPSKINSINISKENKEEFLMIFSKKK